MNSTKIIIFTIEILPFSFVVLMTLWLKKDIRYEIMDEFGIIKFYQNIICKVLRDWETSLITRTREIRRGWWMRETREGDGNR